MLLKQSFSFKNFPFFFFFWFVWFQQRTPLEACNKDKITEIWLDFNCLGFCWATIAAGCYNYWCSSSCCSCSVTTDCCWAIVFLGFCSERCFLLLLLLIFSFCFVTEHHTMGNNSEGLIVLQILCWNSFIAYCSYPWVVEASLPTKTKK